MTKHISLALALIFLGGCGGKEIPAVSKPPAVATDDIAVYFSPKGGALAAILREINSAQRSIDVQAYLMTSRDIVETLQSAARRGVHVRVILDKRNMGGVYSYDAFLRSSGIPTWRDGAHKDFHDKIMLIDGQTIITGSFNFTDQSEEVNGENLLIIRNRPRLFAAYQTNFDKHLAHSDPPAQ